MRGYTSLPRGYFFIRAWLLLIADVIIAIPVTLQLRVHSCISPSSQSYAPVAVADGVTRNLGNSAVYNDSAKGSNTHIYYPTK